MTNLSSVHGWIYGTLQTITSLVFNEFAIRPLDSGYPWNRINGYCWGGVDALLDIPATRNPDFMAVLMGRRDWHFLTCYLPLAKSMGLIRFGSPRVESQFEKLGVL